MGTHSNIHTHTYYGSNVFNCPSLSLASRNINDWWLAYWISHTHSGETSNVTAFNATPSFYLPSSPSSYFDPESDSGSTMPLLPLTSSSDNLVFYLGVYGGLAAANSVSSRD